jgi:hypothetical protein
MTKPRILIPHNMNLLPERFELSAALILLDFFKDDIAFLPVTSSKTPDILANNIRWEIKSPIGKGKRNIQHQIYRAMKQSKNIVFNARRSKIDIRKIRKELNKQSAAPTLKRLILITKESKVEVIK